MVPNVTHTLSLHTLFIIRKKKWENEMCRATQNDDTHAHTDCHAKWIHVSRIFIYEIKKISKCAIKFIFVQHSTKQTLCLPLKFQSFVEYDRQFRQSGWLSLGF